MIRTTRLRVPWLITLLVISTSLEFVSGVPINQDTLQKYDNGGLLPNSYQGNDHTLSQDKNDAGEFGNFGMNRNNQVSNSEEKKNEQSNFPNNVPQLNNQPSEQKDLALAQNNAQAVDGQRLVNNPTENQDGADQVNPIPSASHEQPSENNVPQFGDALSESKDQPENTNLLGNDGKPLQSGNDNGLGNALQNNPPQQGSQNVPYGQPQNNLPQYQNANSPPLQNDSSQLLNKVPTQPIFQNNNNAPNGQILQKPFQQFENNNGLGSDGQLLQNNQQAALPMNTGNNQPPQDVPQEPLSSVPVEGKAEDPSRSQEVNTGSVGQGLAVAGNAEDTKNISSVESTLKNLGLSGLNEKEQGPTHINPHNPQEGQGQNTDSRQAQPVEEKPNEDKNYAMNWKLQKLAQVNMQGYEGTKSSTSVMPSSSTTTSSHRWGGNDETQKDFWEHDNIEDDSDEDDNDDTYNEEEKDKQYTEDGYLDAPADNVDNVGRPVDKTDEETNRNSNNYDESSDANQNNQNIMDDNNEQAVYNNGLHQLGGEKDPDDDYHINKDDDEDEDTFEEKINGIDFDQTTPSPFDDNDDDDDHWYDDTGDEDESDIIGGDDDEDDNEDKKEGDLEDTVVDEEALFNRNHPKRPITEEEDNPIYFNNLYPKLKEGLVEYKMIQNRGSINAPSSMVLFYTWIILVVLIAVVTFSAFRYRCKGMLMNGARNYRNGNHGNFKNGEENKKLLENVYA